MRLRLAVLTAVLALATAVGSTGAGAHAPDEIRSSADLPIPGLDFGPKAVGFELRSLSAPARVEPPPAPSLAMPGGFDLVGHEPLLARGMNAALAVHGDYAYVGSRTDGSHQNAGVLVVDVGDPAKPKVVSEIGPPEEGNRGESSRELRILPDQQLLLVLNHGCSELIHRCANTATTGPNTVQSNIRFYDIAGENAKRPKLVSTYLPSRSAAQQPHEFFVWSDPQRPSRVLLYETTPSTDTSKRENLIVTDISRAREGEFPEIAKWTTVIGNPDRDNRLHSLTVSTDGRRGHLAYLGGGFLVADFSDFADAKPEPKVRLITRVENRVYWTDPGAHSAVRLPGRDTVMMTDEVYGKLGAVLPDHGCPWGWVRFIDIARPENPEIVSEYRLPSNNPDICDTVGEDRDNLSSFSAHNPTLTRNLAFVTWHSAGLQVIDTTDPARPAPAAEYVPEPLPEAQTEDPALSSGRDKVVMWSFPIIKDGLVYVVDLRNGLYILRYRGPHEQEVAETKFLDGNSNSGDMQRLEPPAGGGANGQAAPAPGPAAPPTVVGDGRACLAAPVRQRRNGVGPFRLKTRAATVDLRGGPAVRSSARRRRFCVEGGAAVEVVLRRGRVAALLRIEKVSARRVTAAARRARPVGRGVRVRAGRGATRVYVLRRGRQVATGVAQRGLSRRALRALASRAR